MAVSKERMAELEQILKDTAPAITRIEYPPEIMAYQELAGRTVLTMNAAGHDFKVYCVTAKHREADGPLFINIHGGGWVIGHKDNDTCYAAWLAEALHSVVLDVDYTTSDIAPWSVMFEQCCEAVRYAFAHCEELGCDRNRISVGGYSAGGHLTAGIALWAAQNHYPLALQVLCYAPLDLRKRELPPAATEQARKQQARGRCFDELLFRNDDQLRLQPFACPVMAADELLAATAPALVITAGKCGFRFEDEAYAARLLALGVEVSGRRFPEASHGFIPHFYPGWAEASELMVRQIGAARAKRDSEPAPAVIL